MACEALFNSFCYLFLFLPLIVVGYWLLRNQGQRQLWLVWAGFVFYSFWDIRFTVLLFASALVDFLAALQMQRAKNRRAWLIVSVLFNLGVLAFFKYGILLLGTARGLLEIIGVGDTLPHAKIILPIGISFFVFKTLSYTIDVYRGIVPATKNFFHYLAFIFLFPDLVAGPIVRYRQIDDQLRTWIPSPSWTLMGTGLCFLIVGLFKKAVVADTIAMHIDPIWDAAGNLDPVAAWIAVFGFGLQLYFDFSGYSDMAVGSAALLGLRLPINFDAPYRSRSPAEFWRRWHISLSTFLRDYLYIPLGGNRKGGGRTLANLLLVMILGGLWHGASWTFAAWGAYHGVLLIAHRLGEPLWSALPGIAQRIATYGFVNLGWIFFRAPTFADAGAIFADMLGGFGSPPVHLSGWLITAILCALLVVIVGRPTTRIAWRLTPSTAAWLAPMLVFSLMSINSGPAPFLYYQF